MARTPSPTRETRALPNPAFCLRQVFLVDLEPNEFFYAAALRCDGRISNAEKGIEHGLHTRTTMKLGAPFR
jgi:hypothetical protein